MFSDMTGSRAGRCRRLRVSGCHPHSGCAAKSFLLVAAARAASWSVWTAALSRPYNARRRSARGRGGGCRCSLWARRTVAPSWARLSPMQAITPWVESAFCCRSSSRSVRAAFERGSQLPRARLPAQCRVPAVLALGDAVHWIGGRTVTPVVRRTGEFALMNMGSATCSKATAAHECDYWTRLRALAGSAVMAPRLCRRCSSPAPVPEAGVSLDCGMPNCWMRVGNRCALLHLQFHSKPAMVPLVAV